MNILTFDIEEWFHLLDNESTKTINEWKNFESRIHVNMERIFSTLEKFDQKATFFCLGWIAENYPWVVKEIVSRGYEIGTHSRMHQLVYEQSPHEFRIDLERSIKTLEDLTSKKVRFFRAPGFSIREDNKWAFEILAQYGIEVDCSVFPAPRAHGGFSSYNAPIPSLLDYQGFRLKELPINYHLFMGKIFVFSGGGYFRLMPYKLIKKWTNQAEYVMSYLHPRDFDPEQPIIEDLSIVRKFKAYVGIKTAILKFEKWLTDFEFVDVSAAVESIEWENVPVIYL